MTDLEGLVERLREAKGPDREIDGDLFFELDPEFPNFAMHMSALPDPATFATGAYTSVKAPAYTSSIDAALALVERVLPGWRYDLHSPRFGTPFEAVLMDGDGAARKIVVSTAPTAPIAILAALLTAKDSTPHE